MNGPAEPRFYGQADATCYGQWPAYVQTFTETDLRTPEDKRVDDENNLKVEINTFVWMHAPESMTLGRADTLACKILELFIEANEELKTQNVAGKSP